MPHLWNDIYVVTAAELAPWYNNLDVLQKHITRHKDKTYGIKKVCSGGNGRQLLIAYDSLSADIKNTLGDPRKPAHLMELFYSTDNGAVDFFQTHKTEDGSPLRFALQEEYITNASVLIACARLKDAREKERRSKSISLKGVMATIVNDATSFNKTLKEKHQVEHTLPSSEKRFKIVFKNFLKPCGELPYNYASLISKKVGNQNSRKVTDPVLELLNDMFAGQNVKPTRTQIARTYDGFLQGYVEVLKDQQTGEMYDPKEFKPLSEATIISYLGSWSESIGNLSKRIGDRQKLIAQFKPHHSLQRPKFASSIISVDDRQPPFEYVKGQRPWFYNAIDLGSEAFTCWVYGKDKKGIIVEFYRQLVRNYTEWGLNLPLEIEAESNLNSGFEKTFLMPGRMFEHVRIEANNARGKRIERYFRELRYGNEKMREGWLARPFALNEANQKGQQEDKLLPYNDIIENCLRDIEDWNNSPHSVQADKTRWEVFMENQNPDLKPTAWAPVLYYLGYKQPTSVNVGIIRLQGGEYLLGENGKVCVGEPLIQLMRKVEGKEVDVYWLDCNERKVLKAYVFIGDQPICEAIPKPLYNRATAERTPEDAAARETMSSYVATIDGYRKMKMNSINDVIVIDNTPRTLNRKFVMPGISRPETPAEQPVMSKAKEKETKLEQQIAYLEKHHDFDKYLSDEEHEA